jgi:thiol-disulfide isomerase/thioredoxin
MNKNTGIIIGIIALVVIVGGAYASISNNTYNYDETMKDKVEDAEMSIDETIKGSYEAYSPEKLARAEKGDVVLFFHASWCPSCRGLNSDIEDNMNSIPEGVSILKLDYDKETELKKKYVVTHQHTLVQVDKDGNLIKKWSGSPNLASLVSEIQ